VVGAVGGGVEAVGARRPVLAFEVDGAVALVMIPSSGQAANGTDGVTVQVVCNAPAWAEGNTYTVGTQVTYNGHLYQALQTHTAYVGAGWNPAATPSLWQDLGACTGGTPPASPPGGSTCAVKSRPAGKVLQGYWENWDGAANGVHPGLGWIPITDSRIAAHGYNVINAAFPVIRSDGTVLWENGMDVGVKVATPADMCAAKAAGATILMSIGGAAAGIDISSSTVADRFIATIVPILRTYNFDGIDIDIETGLTGSGNINMLSASQANLIRIIDGVLGQMPSNFGLTMAPETAYVTGGSVTYGSIWGAYLPIVKKYADNGRLWWLNNGLIIQGTTIRVPYDKQVPGLPAQSGAGGGYITPALVTQCWNAFSGSLKGPMT
jgi:chitinase